MDLRLDLGSLVGSSSWGLAINNSGTVPGFATTRTNVYYAFVSTNGGKMQEPEQAHPAEDRMDFAGDPRHK